MRLMDDVLRPFTKYFEAVYLDDILIFNKTWEEHMQHIQQVLSSLRKHKLYANMKKFSFGMNWVHGVHVYPFKIQFIRDWPVLTKLHSFLGLANFYHRFMLGFSHIFWALIQVTKGSGKGNFAWGKEQQRSFSDLKHCLC
jgi:hypothetical protein